MVPLPLSGLRLAVTMPPSSYFGGCDLAIARDHVFALRGLGAVVYELDTTPAYQGDDPTLRRQLDDLRDFRPDAAIGAPHGGYAIQPFTSYRDPEQPETPNNLFLDRLEVPTLLYWDHALLQPPRYLVSPWPESPEDSTGGVIRQLRALFTHPLAVHFFSDSGHIAELRTLGIAEFRDDVCYVPGISHQYVEYGRTAHHDRGQNGDVAFFGNIYIAAARRINYVHQELLTIRQQALAAVNADWDRSPYEAYLDEIKRLDAGASARLRLDPDQSFYWRFLFDELSYVANGERRLRMTLACGRPLTYFGGFADPESRAIAGDAGCALAEEYVPYGSLLAAAYQRRALAIDVANAPYINGFSTKLFSCFAAGGFMLTTRKADLDAALGDLADPISFSTAEELAAKVDRFLAAARERRELARQIQEVVRDRFTASSLFARTIPMAVETFRARAGRTGDCPPRRP
jgi:hypothetical protein